MRAWRFRSKSPLGEPACTSDACAASPVAARDTVLQLLTRWDPALVARTFHPLAQRYSFVRYFRTDMERISREHGACRPDDVIPLSTRPAAAAQSYFRHSVSIPLEKPAHMGLCSCRELV
jgi:hypothetical protein